MIEINQWLAIIVGIIGLAGVVIGASISYIYQTRLQQRTWKREFILSLTEKVYGPIYRDLVLISEHLDILRKNRAYEPLPCESWAKILVDYSFYLIEEDLRKEMELFFNKVKEYNETVKLARQRTQNILEEKLSEITGVKGINIRAIFKDMDGRFHSPNLIFMALNKVDFKELTLNKQLDRILVERDRRDHEIKKEAQNMFDKVWTETLERVNEDELITKFKELFVEIQTDVIPLRKKIIKKLEKTSFLGY